MQIQTISVYGIIRSIIASATNVANVESLPMCLRHD